MKKEKTKTLIEKEEKVLKKEWKNILFNFIIILLSLLIIIAFYKFTKVTTILLAVLSIIGLLKWNSKLTWVIYLFFGAIFLIGELIMSNYGIWTYNVETISSVPLWLFFLWGLTATFIYETIIEMKKMRIK